MLPRRLVSVRLAAALAAGLGLASPAAAQGGGVHVYSVDFVCGFQASMGGSGGYEPIVKVANYATKIDLHNYGGTSASLSGEVFSTANQRWPASAAGQALPAGALGGGRATLIDCGAIAQALAGGIPAGKPFYSGVVTLRSPEPLVVWATKTTQVCAGLATADLTPLPRPRPMVWEEDGLAFIIYPPPQPPPPPQTVDLSTFDCPAADADDDGNVIVDPGTGRFRGPNGAVPPGLRPVPGTRTPPTPQTPQGGFATSQISISTAIDFERVEGVFVPLP